MADSSEKTLCLYLGSAKDDCAANVDCDQTVIETKTLQLAADVTEKILHNQLTIVVTASELSAVYHPMELSSLMKTMSPNATVSVRILFPSGDTSASTDLQAIHTSFLLTGLIGTSERREADGSRILTARRRPKSNSAAPIKITKIKKRQTKKKTKNKVSMVTLDDDDMIDEDALLADSSNLLAPPPAMSAAAMKNNDDCSGRAPCDNCSCGRAEMLAGKDAATKTPAKKVGGSSNCGKCGMGDAFRCASCPYLGKPAFKADEAHLVLDLQDDL